MSRKIITMPSVTRYLQSIDNAKIAYEVDFYNNGPYKDNCLVFLHGFGGDAGAWIKERELLQKFQIPSIALDLRGHGLSDRSDKSDFYSINNFVADVLNILKVESITKPVLVGHCFGGMISLLIEKYDPKISKGLVLIDTSYKPPYHSEKLVHVPLAIKMLELVATIAPKQSINERTDFSHFDYNNDLELLRIYSDIEHISLKSYLYIVENLLHYDTQQFLEKIKKPTLIIEGEKDIIFTPKEAEYLHKNIKESKLVTIPKAHHVLVITNPKDIVTELVTFVDSLA